MLKIANEGCLLITMIIFNFGVITKLRCTFFNQPFRSQAIFSFTNIRISFNLKYFDSLCVILLYHYELNV